MGKYCEVKSKVGVLRANQRLQHSRRAEPIEACAVLHVVQECEITYGRGPYDREDGGREIQMMDEDFDLIF